MSAFAYPSFSQWLAGRAELSGIMEHARAYPAAAVAMDPGYAQDPFAPIYESRNGHVLGRGSILKSDIFAGINNDKLELICRGSCNFRRAQPFPVCGTGIPTLEGLEGLLSYFTALLPDGTPPALAPLGTSPRQPLQFTHVVWLNLREEPIVYVEGRPFVLRDHARPYANLEHTGINVRRVEAMEKQLKRDTLREAQRWDGRILLHDEDAGGSMYADWVTVPGEQVMKSSKCEVEAIAKAQSTPYVSTDDDEDDDSNDNEDDDDANADGTAKKHSRNPSMHRSTSAAGQAKSPSPSAAFPVISALAGPRALLLPEQYSGVLTASDAWTVQIARVQVRWKDQYLPMICAHLEFIMLNHVFCCVLIPFFVIYF